jgi:predicted tellurium resistance membrane protein TerC
VTTIIIADVSLSLDNVLAVASASHGNTILLGIGLVVSILCMAFASNYIATKIERYPSIQWIGIIVILGAALGMLIE